MMCALEKGREAVRLDPNNPTALAWLSLAESNLGHDEMSRRNIAAALENWSRLEKELGPQMGARLHLQFSAYLYEVTGDFGGALAQWKQLAALMQLHGSYSNEGGDALSIHDVAAARRIFADMPDKDREGRPNGLKASSMFYAAYVEQNWKQAVALGKAANAIFQTQPDQKWSGLLMWPELAEAMARTGDTEGADALIAKTSRDCDDCMRKRGIIAALEGRGRSAARDFAIVAARSPHEPFAETDWGQMLMDSGDLDGAMAKFAAAERKGPHFADPLEMWGEALIARNRSDLALEKFAQAEKYAPKWGRLHVKWGEALLWSGNREGARTQFAAARALYLTGADKRELDKVSKTI
jgi:tetratricopeptide (TPR) repeat protein